jgi:hypothetical protein
MMTEEFVRTTVAGYQLLAERIKEVAIQIETIQDGTRNPKDDYIDFRFEDDKLIAHFEYYSYGDTDHDNVEIPLEYLWMENFTEVETKRHAAAVMEEKRLVAEKKAKDIAERQRLDDARDRARYAQLKQKFENVCEHGMLLEHRCFQCE